MKEGTTRPPMILFGRYGSNHHCASAGDDNHHFVVADKSEHRARRVNVKPSLLGYSTRSGSKAAREQEQGWIDIDDRKTQK